MCVCVLPSHLAAWYRLLLENAWDHFNTSLKWNLRWRAAKWTWQEKFCQKVTFDKFSKLVKLFHLWHISATHPPLGLKSSLLCFRFLIRPGRASEKLFSILQIASIMRLHLTCHFKGGLMVVLLKRHPFLTNKTDTLSKWDGVAKPDQFLWQLRVTILHFLQTCNQLSLNSFYLAHGMFFCAGSPSSVSQVGVGWRLRWLEASHPVTRKKFGSFSCEW